jgi:HEAT repeat protein
MGGSKVAPGLLERLALTFLKSPAGLIERKIAEEAINKSHGQMGTVELAQNEQAIKSSKAPSLINSSSEIIRSLLVTGLLKQNSAGFLAFIHPLVLGFLGRSAIEEEFFSQIKSASKFSLRDRVVLYYSGNVPAGEAVYLNLLDYDEGPFHSNLVELLEYSRYTSWSMPWKNEVIRYAVRVVHDTSTPRPIIGSLLAACLDDSPGMVSLLRQLVSSSSDHVRKNALLSLGCIPDPKSTSDFIKCLNDSNPEVKIAACLALANHAAPQSLQFAIKILSEGDETARQAVAECLAWRGKDGAAALAQASQSPNLLTRRAAVFGLAEVHQEWAQDLLKKIAVGDNQWLVRNAASHLIENEGSPRLSALQKKISPSETPWLIEAAAKQNVGISPGQPATDILINILESGSREQKLAAIGLLSSTPSELRGISEINKQTACGDSEIEEYALLTLWNLEKSSLSD